LRTITAQPLLGADERFQLSLQAAPHIADNEAEKPGRSADLAGPGWPLFDTSKN